MFYYSTITSTRVTVLPVNFLTLRWLNLTTPSFAAWMVKFLETKVPLPAILVAPTWRTIISPALTFWPAYLLTPRR